MYQPPYGQQGYAPVSRWGMQIDPVTGVPIYTTSAAPPPAQNGYANPQVTQFIPQNMQPIATAFYAPPPQGYPQQQWYPPPTQQYPPPTQYQTHQTQPSYVAPTTNNPYVPPNNSQNNYGTTNTTQTSYSTNQTSTTQSYPPPGQTAPPPTYTNTYPPPSSSPRTSFVNPAAPPSGYAAPPPPQIPPYPDQTQQQYPPHQQSMSTSFSSSQPDLSTQIRNSLSHISVNPAQTDQEMLLAKVRSNASSPARVSGYLLKMGGGGLLGAAWQKRWLCFKSDHGKWFLHYSKQPESNDRGKIELDGCRCEKYPNVYMDKSMTFYVRPKEGSGHSRKEYFFACESLDELFLWVATINKAAGNVDLSVLPNAPSPSTSSSSLSTPTNNASDPQIQQQQQQQVPSSSQSQDAITPNDIVIQTQTYTPGSDTTSTSEDTQPGQQQRRSTRQESQYADFLNIYNPSS